MHEKLYISIKKRRGWSSPQSIEEFIKENYEDDFEAIKKALLDTNNVQCFDSKFDFISNEEAVEKLGYFEEQAVFLEGKAKNDFTKYLAVFPNGYFIDEVKENEKSYLEERIFNKDQSLVGIKKYLTEFPDGKFVNDAEHLFFQKVNTFSDIQDYFALFPNRKYSTELEKEMYDIIKKTGDLAICEYYLQNFPEGKYWSAIEKIVTAAKEEKAELEAAKDLSSINDYLVKYPIGRFHKEAALKYLLQVRSVEDFRMFKSLFSKDNFDESIEYALYELAVRLKRKEVLRFYIKHFPSGKNILPIKELLEKMNGPVKLFISYAHEDQKFKNRFVKGLARLIRQKNVDVWQDSEINAGKDFEKEIFTNLNDSEVISLLVSPDFIASEYCYSKELKIALSRHEKGEARLVPIIVRSTPLWQNESFGRLQALPQHARPIKSWNDEDEAWTNVIEAIEDIIKELRQ